MRNKHNLWADLGAAALKSLAKLDPRKQVRNPVMFIVYLGTILVSGLVILRLAGGQAVEAVVCHLLVWLWFTVLFANFAEGLAEVQGKARSDSLKKLRTKVTARLREADGSIREVSSGELKAGDVFVCESGDILPADGEVIEGIASVDESAITGESAPVVRESGGDRSAVTGGTRVLSDRIVVRVGRDPGEGFLDKMAALVDQAKRQKTPGEIALTILLASFSLIFVLSVVSLHPLASYTAAEAGSKQTIPVEFLVALLVTLVPTTIGSLLSAIGISGVRRLMEKNVIALSGRAVEAAGDTDVLLVDKTGTVTYGNRRASEIFPAPDVSAETAAEAALAASWSDDTPEGKSTVDFIKRTYRLSSFDPRAVGGTFVPFSAHTRMSGVDCADKNESLRKGSLDAVRAWIEQRGGVLPPAIEEICDRIAKTGGTPLVFARGGAALGVIHLKDVVKPDIKERFARLHRLGIRTVMVTGDNKTTAAAIAAEAGLSDFVAEAKPETKLRLIRSEQEKGHLVAMMGDGTNDSPALAQADVGIAMGSGTQSAREAGNMIDFDDDPTKILEVVEVGKQLLTTRGSLTTFSIANDVAKYFAILPALFMGYYGTSAAPGPLSALNIMALGSSDSAILSAIIFNALIIVALIPMALRGGAYRALEARKLLRNNLLIYGLGGIIAPFAGIKLIDLAVNALGIV